MELLDRPEPVSFRDERDLLVRKNPNKLVSAQGFASAVPLTWHAGGQRRPHLQPDATFNKALGRQSCWSAWPADHTAMDAASEAKSYETDRVHKVWRAA